MAGYVSNTYEEHVAERRAYSHIPLDRDVWASWRFGHKLKPRHWFSDPCDDWSAMFATKGCV